jgi:hypothetical protein
VTTPEPDDALARELLPPLACSDAAWRTYHARLAAALRSARAAGADEENAACARLCDIADWRTSPAEIAALIRARRKPCP